jgi:hypothetical protein
MFSAFSLLTWGSRLVTSYRDDVQKEEDAVK